MATLYKDAAVLTTNVLSVIPSYDTIKVINRLLSGQYHAQTIGTGARIANVTCIVTNANKNIIDLAESECALLKVTADGKYYTGYVKEAPSWDRSSPDVYNTSLILLVTEEGSL